VAVSVDLKMSVAQNLALEVKVCTRLLFNVGLCLGGGVSDCLWMALHAALMTVLSQIVKSIPDKARESVGVKELVESVDEFINVSAGDAKDKNSPIYLKSKPKLFDWSLNSSIASNTPLTIYEQCHCMSRILGIVVIMLSCQTLPSNLSPLLSFIAFNLDLEWEKASAKGQLTDDEHTGSHKERYLAVSKACTILLFLLQSLPG